MRTFHRTLAAALVAVTPAIASAAGLELPENGAIPLARGGTAVSSFGTAYSLQFNPAGLAWVDGLDVRIDGRIVGHSVSFERAAGNNGFDPVSNGASPFFAPGLHVAYRSPKFLDGVVALGVGIFGPAGVGRYRYPDPVGLLEKNPELDNQPATLTAMTGQRYNLIESNQMILYPSLGLSFRLGERASAGVTLQNAMADLSFRQSLAAITDATDGVESANLDIDVTLRMKQTFKPSAIVGFAFAPTDRLRLGFHLRPAFEINASGTMDLKPTEDLKRLRPIKQTGNEATLTLRLPTIARLGATWVGDRFDASAELVYEGWSANQELVLTPKFDIVVGNDAPKRVAESRIRKAWQDVFGARFGGTFKALLPAERRPGLDVHAGLLFESNAIPTSSQAIDTVTGDRLGVSAGLTGRWKGLALTASGMYYAPTSFTVSDSQAKRPASEPERNPVIVGNGNYSTSAWVMSFGIAWTGLGAPRAAVEPAAPNGVQN
jgi:long-subunit fatty acid transport protein